MVILLRYFGFSPLTLSCYSPMSILINKKCSIMYIICLLHVRINSKTFMEYALCWKSWTDPEYITMLHGSTVWNTHSKINLLVWGHWNNSHVWIPFTSTLGFCYYPHQHTFLYVPPAILFTQVGSENLVIYITSGKWFGLFGMCFAKPWMLSTPLSMGLICMALVLLCEYAPG